MRAAPLLLLMLAACAREEAAPDASPAPAPLTTIQLPADYVPGGVYGIDADECVAAGGAMTVDGNGLSFCALGRPYAVFVCEGGLIVSLIERDAGRKVIHLSTGDFVEALPAADAAETWVSGDYTVSIKGGVAEFSGDGETLDCLPAR